MQTKFRGDNIHVSDSKDTVICISILRRWLLNQEVAQRHLQKMKMIVSDILE